MKSCFRCPAGEPGVADALARAVAFLERHQLATGELPIYASNDPTLVDGAALDPSIFPNALAAWSLSFWPAAAGVRMRICAFLAAEMSPDGLLRHWPRSHPHHRSLPPDLDDTSCASVALAAAGIPLPDHRALILADRDSPRALPHLARAAAALVGCAAHGADLAPARARADPLLLLSPDLGRAARRGRGGERQHPVPPRPVRRRRSRHRSSGRGPARSRRAKLRQMVRQSLRRPAFPRPRPRRSIRRGEKPPLDRLQGAPASNALEAALSICTSLALGVRPDPETLAKLLDSQQPEGSWPRAALYHGGRARLSGGGFAEPHPDTPRWDRKRSPPPSRSRRWRAGWSPCLDPTPRPCRLRQGGIDLAPALVRRPSAARLCRGRDRRLSQRL